MPVASNNEIEKRLWSAADELRANSKLKSSEYSVPVLGLIFLRYSDVKFAENLTEEELALFDMLTRPDPRLTRKEKEDVKTVAQELLDTLKSERLVLDWRKRQQSRAAVQLEIEKILDKLPEKYDKNLYQHKCERVYQHVYDSYAGAGQSIYKATRYPEGE